MEVEKLRRQVADLQGQLAASERQAQAAAAAAEAAAKAALDAIEMANKNDDESGSSRSLPEVTDMEMDLRDNRVNEDGQGGKLTRMESFIEDSQRAATSRPWGRVLWILAVQKAQISTLKSKLVNAHTKLVVHGIPVEVSPAFFESKTPGRVSTLKEMYDRSSQVALSQTEMAPKAKSPERGTNSDGKQVKADRISTSPLQPDHERTHHESDRRQSAQDQGSLQLTTDLATANYSSRVQNEGDYSSGQIHRNNTMAINTPGQAPQNGLISLDREETRDRSAEGRIGNDRRLDRTALHRSTTIASGNSIQRRESYRIPHLQRENSGALSSGNSESPSSTRTESAISQNGAYADRKQSLDEIGTFHMPMQKKRDLLRRGSKFILHGQKGKRLHMHIWAGEDMDCLLYGPEKNCHDDMIGRIDAHDISLLAVGSGEANIGSFIIVTSEREFTFEVTDATHPSSRQLWVNLFQSLIPPLRK